MNDMQIFSNPEFGDIRTLNLSGEPWIVGKDAAVALGYGNTKDALANHVDPEDKQILQRSENATFEIPNRGLTIINESGLYSLIFGSKLDSAKQFTRWITHEVLPAIRKTGCYDVTITEKEPFTNEQRIRVMDIISRCTKHTLPHVLKYCDPEWPISIPEPKKDVSVSITVPPKSEFGEWLTAALLEHGMSQNQLAKAVGCGKASISRFCNSKGQPSARLYQRITEIFN